MLKRGFVSTKFCDCENGHCYVHLLLDFEIISLRIFKTEDLDKIRKETILYIVCEILKIVNFIYPNMRNCC